MRRRDFLFSGAASVALLTSSALRLAANPLVPEALLPGSLLDEARALASRPYLRSPTVLGAPFADLTYNAYRGIRPLAGKAAMLPHGPNFAFDLLPPGLYFPDPVKIDQVTSMGLREIAFKPDLFSFDPRYFGDVPANSPGAGFTGLRLRHRLLRPDQLHEMLVLQGASYFRAIGQAMVYGLSARAVAIGSGGPQPEEFPAFIHLRLHEAQGDSVRLEGVIDSPSLAAHVDMIVHPGVQTRLDLITTIFPRVQVADIGVAPLTSMYLKGPMRASVSDDFRPRVHDSDVLLIENGAGERLWRPIANPARVETSAFLDNAPKSFALYQSARRFEDFEDTEAHYQDRPSAIVRPADDWGPGAVQLVEIPTNDEFLDNIVAFWRPQAALDAGGAYRYAYSLLWTREAPDVGSLAPVLASRSGREHDRPGVRRYVVDFGLQAEDVAPVLSASQGAEISGVSAFPLPDSRGIRVTFLLNPAQIDSADIRLTVSSKDGTPLTPVWLYRWTRTRDGDI